MNNETSKLIEQLAQKLGTTTEYLWSILLKQAPVSATIILIQILIIAIVGFFIYRFHKHLSNDDNEMSYYNSEGLEIFMTVIGIVWVLLAFSSLFFIPRVIYGYFNPEFWALNYIIDFLNS